MALQHSTFRGSKDDEPVIRFPYAVFELKVENPSTFHDAWPKWVQELVDDGSFVEVPSFSKYLTAVSCLLPDKVKEHPIWMQKVREQIMNSLTSDMHTHSPGARSFLAPPSITFASFCESESIVIAFFRDMCESLSKDKINDYRLKITPKEDSFKVQVKYG